MAQVKVGPEYFRKELREYSNWIWAYVREAFQNSIDAPRSSKIDFSATIEGGNTVVSWCNNGLPMDIHTIENKLFSLGGTGKGTESVGGFGKAKTLLYFAHLSYEIVTGNLIVRGCGGDYTIEESSDYYAGTKSTVTIEGEYAANLLSRAKRFCQFAQWSGDINIDGVGSFKSLHKGSFRREFDFGSVYSNKFCENVMVVRMNGIPMFFRDISLDRCVVVELNGSSLERLTSNRDDLLYQYSRVLNSFVTELAVDKRSALKSVKSEKQVFSGRRLSHFSTKLLEKAASLRSENSESASAASEAAAPQNATEAKEEAFAESAISDRFVILNNTGYQIPSHYLPGSDNFGSYSRKLAKMWGNILIELHRLFDHSSVFSIGFVFEAEEDDSPAAAAMFEKDGNDLIYYISPAKSHFKKRFKLTDRDTLICYALHEFIHGIGHAYHNEDFASALTHKAAIVLKNRKRFNWCFSV